MPRASKRKSAPQSPSDGGRSATAKAKTKDEANIKRLFDTYASSSLGMIDPEGIEALCSDLGLHHTDIRILIFAWKLGAAKQGYFTQDEWRAGMKALRVDTFTKLKKALPDLENEVTGASKFEDFYCYAFRYCLTEEKQKGIDIESACELLNLVLGSRFRQQVDLFSEYLKMQSDYKVLNFDQWINFLRFCNEISFPDLANYDANEAWPLILDNFVEWLRKRECYEVL